MILRAMSLRHRRCDARGDHAIIPKFTGDILQAWQFSAIKIDGRRAYELAREALRSSRSMGPKVGRPVSDAEMEPRLVGIDALSCRR